MSERLANEYAAFGWYVAGIQIVFWFGLDKTNTFLNSGILNLKSNKEVKYLINSEGFLIVKNLW